MTPFRKQTRALKAFSDMMQSQGEKLSRKLWPQGKQYCLQPKERHQGLCQFLAQGLLFTPAAVVCKGLSNEMSLAWGILHYSCDKTQLGIGHLTAAAKIKVSQGCISCNDLVLAFFLHLKMTRDNQLFKQEKERKDKSQF